jgi:Domain of unknown function (DUF4384)
MARTDSWTKGFISRTSRPLGLLAITALSACATQAPAPAAKAAGAQVAPAAARVIADVPAMRRCMDNLLSDNGMRDVPLMVEPLADATANSDAGARDLLASAVSDMTQRSRAIRVVASGQGATAAHYVLRGAIRPLEDGTAAGSAATVIGIDLTLYSAHDMSVVPGTASRNVMTAPRAATGAAGYFEMRKFGAQLILPTGNGQGQAQALRALVDVASIELIGRLSKIPYWSCFGAGPADPGVAAEIQDWYDAMAARPTEIIGWFQAQLAMRRVYDGPLDGAVNPALKEAVASYRAALGLSREPKLSLDFFRAYLGADHGALVGRLASASEPAQGAPAAAVALPVAAAPAALGLHIAATNGAQRFARGEAVQLTVRPSRDAYVYCYLQDENRKVTRFFPNRFQRDARVPGGTMLQLPGAMRFEIAMNPRGVQETVACFATETDVLPRLRGDLGAADLAPLPVDSIDQVHGAFVQASGGSFVRESFLLRAR